MSSLRRKVIWVGLARLAAAGAAVLVNMALARGLSRELNGMTQQALLLANIAILLGQSGIQASCYAFLPRLAPERRRSFFAQSMFLLAVLAGLAAAGVNLCAPALAAEWGNPQLAGLIRALTGFVAFSIAASAAEAVFLTENRPAAFLGATAAWAILHAGLAAALLFLGKPVEWVLGALSAAALVRLAAFAGLAWRILPAGVWGLEKDLLAKQMGFIAPLAIQGTIDILSRWLDRSIISTLYSPAQLAVYTYGALEIPFVGILISAITPVLLPELSAAWGAGDRGRILDLWGRATLRMSAILIPMMLFLYPVADAFLRVFYSSRYAESAPYLRMYLLLLPIRVIAFQPMLMALGRTGWVLAGAGVDLALNAALSVWLIPPLGMLGPAAGTVISTWIQAGVYFVVIGRTLEVPLARLLPWRRLGLLTAEAAIASVLLWFVRSAIPPLAVLVIAGAWGAGWVALRGRKLSGDAVAGR